MVSTPHFASIFRLCNRDFFRHGLFLLLCPVSLDCGHMAEIVEFVNRGAAAITPTIVDKVLRALPQWKLEFTQIYEPLFPHLGAQLDFLATAVEDFAEGAYKELPFYAV